MNKVELIGRLTADPELKQAGDLPICRFSLAVDRRTKKDGKREADFIRCVVFGKPAEAFAKYMAKGRQTAIVGRIQTGSYEKDGQKFYTTDVIVEEFFFIGNNTSGKAAEPSANVATPAPATASVPEESFVGDFSDFSAYDDELPFI